MEISFSPNFVHAMKTLSDDLHAEVLEKIGLFVDIHHHQALKVHKLTGKLKGYYSFSVNYRIRIVFEYVGKPRRAVLLDVGDHDVYKK